VNGKWWIVDSGWCPPLAGVARSAGGGFFLVAGGSWLVACNRQAPEEQEVLTPCFGLIPLFLKEGAGEIFVPLSNHKTLPTAFGDWAVNPFTSFRTSEARSGIQYYLMNIFVHFCN